MLEVRPLGDLIGAEVVGTDVKGLTDEDFGRIYDAFLKHAVVVVRDQTLEIADLLAYSRRYGVLKPHIAKWKRHPQYPDLLVMDNQAKDDPETRKKLIKIGVGWHSDLGYEDERAKATALYAIRLPSFGGDTIFKSMVEVYEKLPADLKARIEGLRGTFRYGGRTGKDVEFLDKEDQNRQSAVHALVRTHPETGRKSLFVSPTQITSIIGLEPAESDALIRELVGIATAGEPDYTHRWRPGDLLIWDNRGLLHSGAGNYPAHERRLHWRVTIMEHDWVAQSEAA